jgi:hypothetical protein
MTNPREIAHHDALRSTACRLPSTSGSCVSAVALEMNGRVDDQPPIHYSKKRFQKAEKGSLSQQLTQILG